ncbi:MAG: SoxR reducing system RseC family protein [Oscillospiraceae bacterium]|jgi:sigma-E factor negative regulatory protein RseC|nr:SoxR reducing system RseC family protein [Oscillospiraceae bacterium]
MQQTVKVIKCNEDGTAQVACLRQSACSGDCHKCSGCGAVEQTMLFEARNPIGAKPGELVVVESQSGPVLKAAAVLYMLPLVLFIAGYLLGMQWKLGGLIGALAFALSIGIAVAYDRLVMKKKNTVYTITGYVHNVHS